MRTLLRSFIGLATGTLVLGLLALVVLLGLKQTAKPVVIVEYSSDLLEAYFGRGLMDNTATFEELWDASYHRDWGLEGTSRRRRVLISGACNIPHGGFGQFVPAVTRKHYADEQAWFQEQLDEGRMTQAQMDEELMTLRTEMGVPEEFYIRLMVGFEDLMGEMVMYPNSGSFKISLPRELASAIGADWCIQTRSNMTTKRALALWGGFMRDGYQKSTGEFASDASFDHDRLSLANWVKRSSSPFYPAVVNWSGIIGGVIGLVIAWRYLLIRLLRRFSSLLVGASRSAKHASKAIDNAAENWNSPRDPE